MTRSRPAGRRDQRGFAMSSPLAVLSVVAVLAAGVAFVATDGEQATAPVRASTTARVTPTPVAPSASTPTTRDRTPARKPVRKPPVRRGGTYVEVFNNSGIQGLASSTASRASGAGWQVVGSDNWYGTIPASTVYYPVRLKAEATLLGKDLGIARVKPIIAPMRGDRLTVILTRDHT